MDQPSPHTLSPGTLLRDTYMIQRRLAVGGMGEVYEASHVRMPGRFAVKVLSPRLASDPAAVARFCREAAIASVLRHPHIVQVFDFDVSGDQEPFLVMECLPGRDLAEHLLIHGPLSLARVVNVVRQIAAALEAAHRMGIVHRDLKPANVMLLEYAGVEDFVKVLDFGVSKICGVEAGGVVLGTPSYMAPEQAEGRGDDVDPRTDQFSLAVLTFALLTGSSPFDGNNTADVLRRILDEDPRPLDGLVPWPAAAVEQVLGRALAKAPGKRFAGVADFAEALARAAASVDEPLRDQTQRGAAGEKMCELDTVISLRPALGSVALNRRPSSQEVTIESITVPVLASIPKVA
jgi:eukaryotic-like serine/threonine-protein kinase